MAVDLKVEPLAPECGVTIHDVRLADAEGEVLDAIRRAVFAHGVAVFRG